LKKAIEVASENSEVLEFMKANDAYLVSAHVLLASEESISNWGLNYYSPTLAQAKTFSVSQEIGLEYTLTSEGLSELREKDLKTLELSETKPLQDLINKAYGKKIGTIANIIVTVSHPQKYTYPILRVNLISSQLFINSIVMNMKSGRILSNKSDNITGTRVLAGTVKLNKDQTETSSEKVK